MPDELLDEPVHRSWEDYWAIVLRRRWWILLPLFLVWAGAWGVSWLWPSTYESEALILVEQQKVPDQYVIPNVTTNLQGRLQSISQQILSRARLQSTIDGCAPRSKGQLFSTMCALMAPSMFSPWREARQG